MGFSLSSPVFQRRVGLDQGMGIPWLFGKNPLKRVERSAYLWVQSPTERGGRCSRLLQAQNGRLPSTKSAFRKSILRLKTLLICEKLSIFSYQQLSEIIFTPAFPPFPSFYGPRYKYFGASLSQFGLFGLSGTSQSVLIRASGHSLRSSNAGSQEFGVFCPFRFANRMRKAHRIWICET